MAADQKDYAVILSSFGFVLDLTSPVFDGPRAGGGEEIDMLAEKASRRSARCMKPSPTGLLNLTSRSTSLWGVGSSRA
jgi:hypothetical protein